MDKEPKPELPPDDHHEEGLRGTVAAHYTRAELRCVVQPPDTGVEEALRGTVAEYGRQY